MSGFRKLLRARNVPTIVELPELGVLEDGMPFAVMFRSLKPIEWWATRFGEFGSLPIVSELPPDDAELEAMRKVNVAELRNRYEYARAVVGTAVTKIRDCEEVEGAWMSCWKPVELVKPGEATDFEENGNGITKVPIEMLETGQVITTIFNEIVNHANFGGHDIREAPFRGSS